MSNPILNDKFVRNESIVQGEPMTVNGTLQVAFILGVIFLIAANFTWIKYFQGYTDMFSMLVWGGCILGFILALIISFARVKFLIPIYAACQGCALGGISAVAEQAFPGIVMQAVGGTFAAFFSMLILYRVGAIKCTDKFKSVIFIATLSIVLVYLIDFIGSFFGFAVPAIHSNSLAGIGVSLIIVVIAALNLIIDFDFIERGAQNMLSKDYEWFGAFGLMVTLVWLYLEVLRLLSKLQSRD